MPLTKLDTTAALVVIDLQKGIVGLPTVHPVDEVVGRTAQLARAFRKRGWPVVLVNVTARAPGRTDTGMPKHSFSPDWAEFVPELERQPSDHLVAKQSWGAFLGTGLD
ncbi:MAG: isochorismatase family protein, partial [Candidatus Sulfotelmatobacter sp.]